MSKVRLRSEKVETILIHKHQSQNWLANRASISKGYLSQLMKGDRYPSGKVRQRILKVLKESTFEDLFEILPNENQTN